jgi:hypothetical protein
MVLLLPLFRRERRLRMVFFGRDLVALLARVRGVLIVRRRRRPLRTADGLRFDRNVRLPPRVTSRGRTFLLGRFLGRLHFGRFWDDSVCSRISAVRKVGKETVVAIVVIIVVVDKKERRGKRRKRKRTAARPVIN